MADNNNSYPFPNVHLSLGSNNRFVADLQRALGLAETGLFDFLTLAHVVVHKFRNGLNHDEPIVDHATWDSIFNRNQNNNEQNRNNDTGGDRPEGPGANATPSPATTGQINRTQENEGPGRAAATTTGNTNATDENIPAPAQPDTNPDRPREDMPTVTAEEQQATGGPAGGNAAVPTENDTNTPAPPSLNAGAETEGTNNGGDEPGNATP
jgi:hypothetical protein